MTSSPLPTLGFLELRAITFVETVHATLHSLNYLDHRFHSHFRFALAAEFENFRFSWSWSGFPSRIWIVFCDKEIPLWPIPPARRAKVYELDWNEKGEDYIVINRYAAEFLADNAKSATVVLYQTPPHYWDSYPLTLKEDWVLGGLRWLHSPETPPLWTHVHTYYTLRLIFSAAPPPWKPS